LAVLRFAADFFELRGGMPHLLIGFELSRCFRSPVKHEAPT
jgi:hypothetical protein